MFVLSDLDLGMNLWMSEPFEYPSAPMDRGKVLSETDLERLGQFARYRDVDGDGITYRTLPGNKHPLSAWFARGTGHNEQAAYSERPDDWEQNLTRLMRKAETARQYVPHPVQLGSGTERIGLIYYGSTDPAVQEALERMERSGLRLDALRLRAVPFTSEVKEFIRSHDHVYVLEMNHDGQMHKLLQLEAPEGATKLRSVTHNNGIPLTAQWIANALQTAEEG